MSDLKFKSDIFFIENRLFRIYTLHQLGIRYF